MVYEIGSAAFQISIPAVIIIVNAIAAFLLAAYLFQYRHSSGVFYITLTAGAIGVWSLFYSLSIAAVDYQVKIIFFKLEYLGIAFSPVFLLMFIICYVLQLRRLNTILAWFLLIIPVITLFMVFTNEVHHFFLEQTLIDEAGRYLQFDRGPWFWVFMVYVYLIIGSGVLMLFIAVFRFSKLYMYQVVILLFAMFVPMFANLIFIFELPVITGLDMTPVGFLFSNIIITISIYRFHMFRLEPIGRRQIVYAIDDPVLVLDNRNVIADYNTAFSANICIKEPLLGKNVEVIKKYWPEFYQYLKNSDKNNTILVYRRCSSAADSNISEHLFFNLRITPVLNADGSHGGVIAVLRDMTKQKRLEKELRDALDSVKTLRGLLPICANCKKIRDDIGYWHTVEEYIEFHSNAHFSHGLCPECLKIFDKTENADSRGNQHFNKKDDTSNSK